MWMHTNFARYEVEGLVRERIDNAFREGEHARLVRAVRGPKAGRSVRHVLNKVRATLRVASLRAGRLQLQEPTT